jgi:hypothetical protein
MTDTEQPQQLAPASVPEQSPRSSGLLFARKSRDYLEAGGEPPKSTPKGGKSAIIVGAVVAVAVVLGIALGVGLGVGLRKTSAAPSSGVRFTLAGSTSAGVAVSYPTDATPCAVVSALGYVNTPNLTMPAPLPLLGALACAADPAVAFSGAATVPWLLYGGVNYSSVTFTCTVGTGAPAGNATVGAQYISFSATGASVAAGGTTAGVLSLALITINGTTTITSSTASYAVSGNAGVISGSAAGMALLLSPSEGCTGGAAQATVGGLYYVALPGLVMSPLQVAGSGACDATAAGNLFSGSGTAASALYNGTTLSTVTVSIAVSQAARRLSRSLLSLQSTALNMTATAIINATSAQGFTLSATQSGSSTPALSAAFAPPNLVVGELDTFALGIDSITGPYICTGGAAAPRAVTGSMYLKLPSLGLTMSPSPTPVAGSQFCNGSSPQGYAFSVTGAPTSVNMAGLTSVSNVVTYVTGTYPADSKNGSLFSTMTLAGVLSTSYALAADLKPMTLNVIASSVKPAAGATPNRTVVASVNLGVAAAGSEFLLNATMNIQYPCSGAQNGTAAMTLPALGDFVLTANISSADCALSKFTLRAFLPAQATLAGFGVATALLTVVHDSSKSTSWNFSVTMPLTGDGLLTATWQKPFTALVMTATYPSVTASVFSNAMYALLYPAPCTACPVDMPDLASSPLASTTLAAGLAAPTYTNLVALMRFATPTPGKLSGTTLSYIGATGSVSYLGATTTGGLVLKKDSNNVLRSLITIDMPCTAAGFALYPSFINAALTAVNAVAQFTSMQVVRSSAPAGFFSFFSAEYGVVPQGISMVFASKQTVTALAGSALGALIGSIDAASGVTAPSGDTFFIGTWLGTAAASTIKVSMATTACSYELVSGLATKGYSFFLSYTAGAAAPSVGITLTPLTLFDGTDNALDVTADLQYNAPSGANAGSFSADTQYTGATPWTNPFGISSNLQIAYPIGITMTAASSPFTFGSLGLAGTINSLADTRYATPMSGEFSLVSPAAGGPPTPAVSFSLNNVGVGRLMYALTKDLLSASGTESLSAPLTALYPWLDGMSVESADVSYNPTSAAITDALDNVIPVGLKLDVTRLEFFDLFKMGTAVFTLPSLLVPTSWPAGVQIYAALDDAISIGGLLNISGDASGTTPPSLLICAVPPTVDQVVGGERRLLAEESLCTPGTPLMAVHGYISVLGQSLGVNMAASSAGFAVECSISVLGLDFSLSMALDVPQLWTGGFSGSSLLSTLAGSNFAFGITAPALSDVAGSVSSAVGAALTDLFNGWEPFQTLQSALDALPDLGSISGAVSSSAVLAVATSGLESTAGFGQDAMAAFTSAFGNGYTYDPANNCPLGNGNCCITMPTIEVGAITSAVCVPCSCTTDCVFGICTGGCSQCCSGAIPATQIGGNSYCPPAVTISLSSILGQASGRRLLSGNTTAAFAASVPHRASQRKLTAIDTSSCVTSTTYSATITSPAISISAQSIGLSAPDGCSTLFGDLCNPSVEIPEFSTTLDVTVPTSIDETCLTNLLGESISVVTDFATTYATGPFAGLAKGLTSFLDASSSGFSNVFSIDAFDVAPIALSGSATTLSATASFTLLGTAYTDQELTLPLGADVSVLADAVTGVAAAAFTSATNLVG